MYCCTVAESLAEKFKRWKNRVEVGAKTLDDQALDWKKYRDAYDGKILTESDYQEQVSVNLQYVDVRSSIPKLYSQSPYIYIDPEVPSADLNAEIMERVINAVKDKKWHLKERMREAIKAAKLDGRSYLKVSYKFDGDKIGRSYVGDEPNDEISIQVVLRKDLILPRDATSVQDARWVAHRIREQVGKVRSKFKLKPDDRPIIIEDSCADAHGIPDDEKEDFQYCEFFEVEDRENHQLSIIVSGVDRYAVKPYDHPYDFYTMYVPIEWNDIPGELNTRADLHFWWKQLKQLAFEETMRVNHARRLNSKYIYQGPTPLNEEQAKGLQSYRDAEVVQLPVGGMLIGLQHATLGQEFYLGNQTTRQDITILSAMNEMKQGLPQAKKTAREAMAIVAESQDVIGYRASIIEDAVAAVIEKCIWLIQKNYDTTRVVALTGMEQAEFLGLKDRAKESLLGDFKKPFLKYVGTKLLGEMAVRVKAGSARPTNEDQRKQDLIELFTAAASNQQIAAAIDGKEALKEFAKVLNLENKGIIIDPKSPEQESALLKRNVPVMPGLSDNHDDHIARHEIENNSTPAFIAHMFVHELMKTFVSGSQLQVPQSALQAATGPGGLSQENISGVPMGSSVPPSAMPQPGPAMTPGSQPPANAGLPL